MEERSAQEAVEELLRQPAFQASCQRRDFGVVFAMVHDTGTWSYNRIAEACLLPSERVSKLARGNGRVTALETIERIADGLHLPGALLGLAARDWETAARTCTPQSGDDPMKRRHLLRSALAAGMSGPALTSLASSRAGFDQALAHTPPDDLPHLEAACEQSSYGYRGRPPTELLADLVDSFDGVRALLARPQTAAVRMRLCHLAGQTAGMTAIVLHDVGQDREARAWFHSAGRAAEESGDSTLHAWVLGREAMVPLNFGAPRAAAALAERASHTAGRAPTAAAALATAVAARAYALSGQHEAAHQALGETDRITELLTGEQRADTWLGLPEQKLHVHRSHALTTLGATDRARQSQQLALDLSGPTSTMTRGLLQLDAAACLRHDGDTAAACAAAADTLEALPHSWRTGLTHTRALELYRSIPATHAREPAARRLHDALQAAA